MKKILFVKTEEETWDSFAKDLVSSVTSLNAIELPKLSTVSLHSIVQSAIGKKGAQSFISLKADLCQDINRGFAFP